ncbi:MAG: FAD/NAD(P)-binding protein, partial [Paeniglutamicibacter terrestris]
MSEKQNSGREPYVIAVVGAGPRGTSILERLESELRRTQNYSRKITVVVFDVHDPGAGHVWSTAQS